jgi:hypothetical protein
VLGLGESTPALEILDVFDLGVSTASVVGLGLPSLLSNRGGE